MQCWWLLFCTKKEGRVGVWGWEEERKGLWGKGKEVKREKQNMYAAVIYNLNMIMGRRRPPLYCLILFPSLPPRLQPEVVICTRRGAREEALPGVLCGTQRVCFNVLWVCVLMFIFVFFVCFNVWTHAYLTVYSLRSENSTCVLAYTYVEVYTQSSPWALTTSLACTSLWDYSIWVFSCFASQASGSMHDRTSQKHCNNKIKLTLYKWMESS